MLNIIPGTEQMTTLVWEIFMHHTLPERPRRILQSSLNIYLFWVDGANGR